ncbi:hypothetical protein LINGRAPRIM_LOCUS554 [Linum grandiflorum]
MTYPWVSRMESGSYILRTNSVLNFVLLSKKLLLFVSWVKVLVFSICTIGYWRCGGQKGVFEWSIWTIMFSWLRLIIPMITIMLLQEDHG